MRKLYEDVRLACALPYPFSFAFCSPAMLRYTICLALAGMFSQSAYSRDTDTTTLKDQQWQARYVSAVNAKTGVFNSEVEKYTDKTLEKIIRQEKKMQRKVAKVDSVKAKLLFAYSIDSLQKFQSIIKNRTGRIGKLLSGNYFPYLDTLKQSLGFLNKTKNALDAAGNAQTKMNSSLNSVDRMESDLSTADQINEYLKQRQAILQQQLNSIPGLAANLANINKQAVYYQAQISEYKSTLQDPDKIEKLALNTLEKLPAFQKFFQQNGQLSGLFASPGGFSAPGAVAGSIPVVNGLPSRAAMQQFLQGQLPGSNSGGADPTEMVQQQAGSASAGSGLDNLTSQLHGQGGNGDTDLPDFTPDGQHTKSFLKRLEFGANMQFGSSTNGLPTRSNFGMQAGYKLNDRSSIGLGLSYTMGLGTGWNHIQFTNEAVGFRTYASWKPKKKSGFYLQGGAEWNYLTQFGSIAQLRHFDAWQTSALAGVGKTYKINKKLSGNLLLLYDFLYNRHVPATQPLLLRMGYNF